MYVVAKPTRRGHARVRRSEAEEPVAASRRGASRGRNSHTNTTDPNPNASSSPHSIPSTFPFRIRYVGSPLPTHTQPMSTRSALRQLPGRGTSPASASTAYLFADLPVGKCLSQADMQRITGDTGNMRKFDSSKEQLWYRYVVIPHPAAAHARAPRPCSNASSPARSPAARHSSTASKLQKWAASSTLVHAALANARRTGARGARA